LIDVGFAFQLQRLAIEERTGFLWAIAEGPRIRDYYARISARVILHGLRRFKGVRQAAILDRRARIKRETLARRKKENLHAA